MASEVHGTQLKSNVSPFCCCVCLPKIKPTMSVFIRFYVIVRFRFAFNLSIHIRRIEMLVYQAAIIRPLLFFACGAAWADMMGDVRTNVSKFIFRFKCRQIKIQFF